MYSASIQLISNFKFKFENGRGGAFTEFEMASHGIYCSPCFALHRQPREDRSESESWSMDAW
jgi:hypothetical protein